MGSYKNSISGPRWAGIPAAIRSTAFQYDLKIVDFIENKGWLFTEVLFKLEGPDDKLLKFDKAIREAVSQYKKETP